MQPCRPGIVMNRWGREKRKVYKEIKDGCIIERRVM
jgi:hypothetical protein